MNKLPLFFRRVIYGRTWAAEGDRWFNDLAELRAHIEELEKDAKFDLFLDIARPAKPAESPWPGSSVPTLSNELLDAKPYCFNQLDLKGNSYDCGICSYESVCSTRTVKEALSKSNELAVNWKENVNVERDLAGMSRLELYKTDRERDVVLTPVVPSLVHCSVKGQAIGKVLQAQLQVFDGEEWKNIHYELSLVAILMVSITSLMSMVLMHFLIL